MSGHPCPCPNDESALKKQDQATTKRKRAKPNQEITQGGEDTVILKRKFRGLKNSCRQKTNHILLFEG